MKKYHCILLVDDDETSNYLSQNVMEEMKLSSHYHTARNGQEALRFVEEHCAPPKEEKEDIFCPDLIFLDLNMPVMDGFEFLSEFKRLKEKGTINKKIDVVVLSSSDNPSDIDEAHKFTIQDYLSKPVTEAKIKQIIAA